MSICCTVCGSWYLTRGSDRLDICPDCFAANFAGAQPPLDLGAPPPPEALTLSPRDLAALRQWQAHWARVQGGEAP